jgi:hypothetical protein
MQFKVSGESFLLGNPDHMECELLEDAIVSDSVRFREQASIDGAFLNPR